LVPKAFCSEFFEFEASDVRALYKGMEQFVDSPQLPRPRLVKAPLLPRRSTRRTSIMAAAPLASSCKVVLAGSIAKAILAEVGEGIKTLNRAPRLHGFLANSDPAARMYADWTAKTCKDK
jgi:methylenetetrahydrofolate dehydrogenase (NAD+)